MTLKNTPVSRTLPSGRLALLDRVFMTRYFDARIPRWYPGDHLVNLRIHDHSHLPYKKSVAYHITLKNPRSRLVRALTLRGNVPSRDTTIEARVADQAMRALWKSPSASDLPISRPLGYDERLRILFYEEVPGETLTSVLQSAPLAGLRGIALAGQWLGHLHKANIRLGRQRGVRREQAEAYFFSLNYGQYHPSCQPRAAKIAQRFFTLRKKLNASIKRESRLIHGDYAPKNIIIAPRNASLTVIDFGNAWRYDPMSDLANALIQIAYVNALPSATIRRAQGVLLRSYERIFPLSGTRRKRLHLFTAWWSLQTLSYIFTLPFTRQYAPLARASFLRAERALHHAH